MLHTRYKLRDSGLGSDAAGTSAARGGGCALPHLVGVAAASARLGVCVTVAGAAVPWHQGRVVVVVVVVIVVAWRTRVGLVVLVTANAGSARGPSTLTETAGAQHEGALCCARDSQPPDALQAGPPARRSIIRRAP